MIEDRTVFSEEKIRRIQGVPLSPRLLADTLIQIHIQGESKTHEQLFVDIKVGSSNN